MFFCGISPVRSISSRIDVGLEILAQLSRERLALRRGPPRFAAGYGKIRSKSKRPMKRLLAKLPRSSSGSRELSASSSAARFPSDILEVSMTDWDGASFYSSFGFDLFRRRFERGFHGTNDEGLMPNDEGMPNE